MLGIYKITNKKTGKFYIGRSRDVFDRFKSHCQLLKTGKHTSIKFQEEMKKHKLEDLIFEILELCSIGSLKIREEFWIKELKAVEKGYNKIEKDEEIKNWKLSIDSAITSYLKKAFLNLHPTPSFDPAVNIIEEGTFEFLLNLFDKNMSLIRPKNEILVIPNKYQQYREPPYVYIRSDFGL